MPGGRAGEEKATQDLLNDMMGLFGLAIHLRMVGRAVQQASTKVTKQVLPKMAHKPGIAVRNNNVWACQRHGKHGARTDQLT